MKNQAVELNFAVVLYAGVVYAGLVVSGWLLVRLTIACFKLPAVLRRAERGQGPAAVDDEDEIPRRRRRRRSSVAGESWCIVVRIYYRGRDLCAIKNVRKYAFFIR